MSLPPAWCSCRPRGISVSLLMCEGPNKASFFYRRLLAQGYLCYRLELNVRLAHKSHTFLKDLNNMGPLKHSNYTPKQPDIPL